MAKKEQKPKLSKQTKQLYVLGALLGVLALAAAYSFLGSSKPAGPAPKPGAAQSGQPAGAQTAKNGQPAARSAAGYGPIEVLPIAYQTGGGDVSVSRNIFDYPPPPPPKPPPPPPPKVTEPPPTINIGSVSPGQAIAGSSKPVPIVVTGSIFPGDAVLLVNGQRVQAQRVSSTVMKATLSPGALASPGSLSLRIESASQPDKLKSGELHFTLTPSPDPNETFLYTGRLGPQAVIAFKEPSKRPKLVGVGETVNGSVPWKVLAINDKQVDLLDTRNDIRKTLALVDKTR